MHETRREWDEHTCPHVTLPDHDLTRDPNAKVYEDQENTMVDSRGDFVVQDSTARGPLLVINSVYMTTCDDAAKILSQSNFTNVLQSNVNISNVNVTNLLKVSADSISFFSRKYQLYKEEVG